MGGGADAGAADTGGATDTGSSPDLGGGMDLGSTSPEGGSEPAGGSEPTVPERFKKDDLNLIVEETLFNGIDYMDLSKGRNSLVEINNKLKDLIDK